ncbi:MAG: aminoglycoside phosphotransferase family protein [Clostridia bacterium]|nr:aminoglycoside phosphotransferase family protein [Clostridia bacterium]
MELLSVAKDMAARFAIPDIPYAIKGYGNGHINDTFRLTPEDGSAPYILQRISPAAFHHPEQVMENMLGVTRALRQAAAKRCGDPDREALSVIPLKDGSSFAVSSDGSAWRMTAFIARTVSKDLPESEEMFLQSGRAFGRFQCDLADYPAQTLYETIPHFHDTPARLAAFEDALAKDVCSRREGCRDVIDGYLARASRAGELTDGIANGTLPLRVTHNDTKLNNVLLDEETLEALCVIDLDTVMPGLPAYDFGDAIRFGASTAVEDERDKAKIRFSLPMYTAFARGYLQEAGGMLSPEEVDSLPVGAWMMTYECGMRFLTDYLSGDTYFHIACEDHNLVRAVNQLTLLEDMERYAKDMLDICRREVRA